MAFSLWLTVWSHIGQERHVSYLILCIVQSKLLHEKTFKFCKPTGGSDLIKFCLALKCVLIPLFPSTSGRLQIGSDSELKYLKFPFPCLPAGGFSLTNRLHDISGPEIRIDFSQIKSLKISQQRRTLKVYFYLFVSVFSLSFRPLGLALRSSCLGARLPL